MPAGDLERGREAYARRAWRESYDALSAAVEPEDLERLAISAFMLGRDHEYVSILERAHDAYLQRGEPLRAFRCAFWCGMILMARGEVGPGSAWIGRAQRLCEGQPDDSVERGYLLMPLAFRHEAAGEFEEAAVAAGEAAAMAERFGETDGFALASHAHGQMLIKGGRVTEGLAVLDQSMLAATRGDLSPMTTGIVYCGVILACQEVFEARRAKEWTAALTAWCESQPDIVVPREAPRRRAVPAGAVLRRAAVPALVRVHADPRRGPRRRARRAAHHGAGCQYARIGPRADGRGVRMKACERGLLVWNGRVARVEARDRIPGSPGRRERAETPEHDVLAEDERGRRASDPARKRGLGGEEIRRPLQ
jgi:hypothetical protein